MRVADEIYLLCHDDRTGNATVAPRVMGAGLAAGLVGELLLSGNLRLHGGGLYPAAEAVAPEDRLAREVLEVVGDGRHDRQLAGWLRFLAVEAVMDVRRRLITDGVLVRVRSRRLLGVRWSYPPAQSNAAAWPGIRLARILTEGEPLPVSDQVLAGLVDAMGLLERVLWDGDTHAPGRRAAARVRDALPGDVAVLVAQTATVVADVVLT